MPGQPADWMAWTDTGWLTDDVCRLSISLGTGGLGENAGMCGGGMSLLVCC